MVHSFSSQPPQEGTIIHHSFIPAFGYLLSINYLLTMVTIQAIATFLRGEVDTEVIKWVLLETSRRKELSYADYSHFSPLGRTKPPGQFGATSATSPL